jgi:AP-4 complex subunit mu-1
VQALLTLQIKCDIPQDKSASGLEIEVPMPKHVQRAHCDIDQKQQAAGVQTWDYGEKTHLLKWKFKKIQGTAEFQMKVRVHAV